MALIQIQTTDGNILLDENNNSIKEKYAILIKKAFLDLYKVGQVIVMPYSQAEYLVNNGFGKSLPQGEYDAYIKLEHIRQENKQKAKEREALSTEVIKKLDIPKGYIKIDNYMDNARQFYTGNPFFYDKAESFWLWNKALHKYEIVDNVDMMILLDRILGMDGQTVTSSIKANYLEAFKRVGRLYIPVAAPKKWIQFKDKAFSLESGKIYDVTPGFMFTNPIPWEIGATDDTPTMDKLFAEWVGDKFVPDLYEIIAYCCYTDYPIHLIFCLCGAGRNGKSTYQKLLSNFIGSDNISSTELDSLIDSRFESVKLFKKLVCQMGETNFGVLSQTSLIKKLCGQDRVGFEFKNKKPFDDYNYAKIIIASNSLPPTEDTSDGFWRRWHILEFNNMFQEGHDILMDVPEIEYNNLARKVCNILPDLLERGAFTNQGTIEQRKAKYILNSNPLSHFIENYCIKEFDNFVRYSELYSAYIRYLNNSKKRAISYKEFNSVLMLEGLEVQKTSKTVNGEYISDRWVIGIKLKEIMTDMTVMLKSSLLSPYGTKSMKLEHNGHNCHNLKYCVTGRCVKCNNWELVNPETLKCQACEPKEEQVQ